MVITSRTDDPDFATTLAHGLALLECFRVDAQLLSNKELSTLTGLSKSTVSRLTYTLAQRGLIAFNPTLRRYSLGAAALSLGHPLLAGLKVRQLAHPLMRRLAHEVDGTVSIGMRDRTRMVYVETVRGHVAATFRPEIGAALPILGSTIGRAWLHQIPLEARDIALAELRALHPTQWRQYQKQVRLAWDDLESKGYCTSIGDEAIPDVDVATVPLPRECEGTFLVFSCGVLRSRGSLDKLHTIMGPGLVRLVGEIDELLAALEDHEAL